MQTKQALRNHAMKTRSAMTDIERHDASRRIVAKLRDFLQTNQAKHVAIYHPMRGEIDLRALADTYTLYLPKITKGRIAFYQDTGTYADGGFGTTVPAHDEETDVNAIDVVVVPGLCYDKRGYRVGYGKGFYDELLSRYHGVNIGVCYADLVVDEIPVKPHDKAVDTLITERGTVKG